MSEAVRFGLYKNRKYQVKFLGQTKHGNRANLVFLDGSKDFWVPAESVQLVSADSTVGVRMASEKQLEALERMMKKLRKVPCLDMESASGEEMANHVQEKIDELGGEEKLSMSRASELIEEVSGYLEDASEEVQ